MKANGFGRKIMSKIGCSFLKMGIFSKSGRGRWYHPGTWILIFLGILIWAYENVIVEIGTYLKREVGGWPFE